MGARAMAQCLRVLTLLPEDQSFNPRTHGWYLTSTCNYSSGGSSALFWTSTVPMERLPMADPYTDSHNYTYN